MEKLVLIDGNSLINRAFYALPILTNSKGEYCNAIYGFCNIIVKVITDEKPDYMAICFDAGKHTFRHDLYSEYKGTRKGMPQELAEQLPLLKEVLQAMNIYIIEKPSIEADDLIGSLAKKFDCKKIIVSGDKDLLQLIGYNTEVHLTKKGVTEVDVMTLDSLKEKMNLMPFQVIELKSLMGDSSDNIPGVPGVGEKTAKDLLNQYQTTENLYEHIDEIKGKLKEKLILNKDLQKLSKVLATINCDVELDTKLDDLKYDFPFNNEVLKLFERFEFNSLLKRKNLFDGEVNQAISQKVNTQSITNVQQFNQLLEEIKKTNLMSIFLDENLSIAFSKFKEYNISFNQELKREYVLFSLKSIFEDEKYKKVCFDVKKLKHILAKENINLKGECFDIVLANYILNGSSKDSDKIIFYQQKYSYDETNKASLMFDLYNDFSIQLKQNNMEKLYFSLELPLVNVLFEMEQNGFKIDKQKLYEISEEYKQEIENLIQEIYQLAGKEFNINSPKQLADVLFKDLLLPKSKKKDTTSGEVLEKLIGVHPIIEKILRYRKITKLNGSYLEDFKVMMDKDCLIHTDFNQALTTTGRLSSVNPNLQNIPVKDEEGKIIRSLFIPREKDGTIISADYSQIELRLLAHFSQDEKLIEAYNNNIDIHAQTASSIFDIPLESVTDTERRKAKTVNFGIIYGMSEYGLSQSLNITPLEAKMYIEKYFLRFPKVKEYMEQSVALAKENGFAVTLFNRKRFLPEINATNGLVRQFGERAAKNMPLQGTAADIIKLAMINVYDKMKQLNLKSKLILQVHDELIIDAVSGEEQAVKGILKQEMENVVKLNIPLVVEICEGKTWREAK